MISQAMLMISMAAIAPSPCNAACDDGESDKPPQYSARDFLPDAHRLLRSEASSETKFQEDENDSASETKFQEDENVWFLADEETQQYEEGTIIQKLDIRTYNGMKVQFYKIFTEKFEEQGCYEIPEILIESKGTHMVKQGESEVITIGNDHPGAIRIAKDLNRKFKKGGSSKFCALYEVAKNSLKNNYAIFKESKCTGKWCCFITSCFGCCGATLCFTTLAMSCFGGGGGCGETICSLCACFGGTAETAEAATCEGRCITCDWQCFKCCEGDADVVDADAPGCCDGCDGCDADCGDCLIG